MKPLLLGVSLLLISVGALASEHAAVVRMLRGQAHQLIAGKEVPLKLDDLINVGTTITSLDKSFVRLVFSDKTQINLGPNSQIVVDRFGEGDSGIVTFIKGKLRSSVSKSYLEMKEKQRSKVFIKTPAAILGVRGTDFLVSVGPTSTSTVLFEGEIAFAKLEGPAKTPADLEAIVERGVRIFPGEFSVQDAQRSSPTVPSLLNVGQLERLEQNDTFSVDRAPSSAAALPSASLVPPGLSGTVAANTNESIQAVVGSMLPTKTIAVEVATSRADSAQGYVSQDRIKPTNGSFLHVESGVVIAPPADAIFDAQTNTFIASGANGTVGADGSYVPPANVEISAEGKITVSSVNSAGKVEKVVVPTPSPVTTAGSTSLVAVATNPPPAAAAAPQWDPARDRPAPSGGLQGVNDPQRTSGAFTDVIFRAP